MSNNFLIGQKFLTCIVCGNYTEHEPRDIAIGTLYIINPDRGWIDWEKERKMDLCGQLCSTCKIPERKKSHQAYQLVLTFSNFHIYVNTGLVLPPKPISI